MGSCQLTSFVALSYEDDARTYNVDIDSRSWEVSYLTKVALESEIPERLFAKWSRRQGNPKDTFRISDQTRNEI